MHGILPLQIIAGHAGTAVLFYIFKVAAQFKINKTGHVFNKFTRIFAAVFGFKGFIVSNAHYAVISHAHGQSAVKLLQRIKI